MAFGQQWAAMQKLFENNQMGKLTDFLTDRSADQHKKRMKITTDSNLLSQALVKFASLIIHPIFEIYIKKKNILRILSPD